MKKQILMPYPFYGRTPQERKFNEQMLKDAFEDEGIHVECEPINLSEEQARLIMPLKTNNPIYQKELDVVVASEEDKRYGVEKPSCLISLEGKNLEQKLADVLPLGKSVREQRNFNTSSKVLLKYFGNNLGCAFWDASKLLLENKG